MSSTTRESHESNPKDGFQFQNATTMHNPRDLLNNAAMAMSGAGGGTGGAMGSMGGVVGGGGGAGGGRNAAANPKHMRSASADFNALKKTQMSARDVYMAFKESGGGGGGDMEKFKRDELENELCVPLLQLGSIKELLSCLDPQNILIVLAALMAEKKIVVISFEKQRVRAILNGLFALLYPFSWQYLCIPWLNPCCREIIKVDQPYVLG